MKYGITFHTKQIKVNKLTTGGKTPKLAKHLSLAHTDLFRELKDWQVSKCIIHKFRLNLNFLSQLIQRTYISCDAVNTKAQTCDARTSYFCTCISNNQIWIYIEWNNRFCYIHFSINNMKGMFLRRCRPLTWCSRERFMFKAFSLPFRVWKQSEGERNHFYSKWFEYYFDC